jgi:hypothetical protein
VRPPTSASRTSSRPRRGFRTMSRIKEEGSHAPRGRGCLSLSRALPAGQPTLSRSRRSQRPSPVFSAGRS